MRQARQESGLTQAELAVILELGSANQSLVSQWERGIRSIPDNYLAAMPPEIRIPIVRARIEALVKLL